MNLGNERKMKGNGMTRWQRNRRRIYSKKKKKKNDEVPVLLCHKLKFSQLRREMWKNKDVKFWNRCYKWYWHILTVLKRIKAKICYNVIRSWTDRSQIYAHKIVILSNNKKRYLLLNTTPKGPPFFTTRTHWSMNLFLKCNVSTMKSLKYNQTKSRLKTPYISLYKH